MRGRSNLDGRICSRAPCQLVNHLPIGLKSYRFSNQNETGSPFAVHHSDEVLEALPNWSPSSTSLHSSTACPNNVARLATRLPSFVEQTKETVCLYKHETAVAVAIFAMASKLPFTPLIFGTREHLQKSPSPTCTQFTAQAMFQKLTWLNRSLTDLYHYCPKKKIFLKLFILCASSKCWVFYIEEIIN